MNFSFDFFWGVKDSGWTAGLPRCCFELRSYLWRSLPLLWSQCLLGRKLDQQVMPFYDKSTTWEAKITAWMIPQKNADASGETHQTYVRGGTQIDKGDVSMSIRSAVIMFQVVWKNSGCVQDLIKSSLLKTLPKSEMETKQNHACSASM